MGGQSSKEDNDVEVERLLKELLKEDDRDETTYNFFHIEENGQLMAECKETFVMSFEGIGLLLSTYIEEVMAKEEAETRLHVEKVEEQRYVMFTMSVMNAIVEAGGSLPVAQLKQAIRRFEDDKFTKQEIYIGIKRLLAEKKIGVKDGRVFFL